MIVATIVGRRAWNAWVLRAAGANIDPYRVRLVNRWTGQTRDLPRPFPTHRAAKAEARKAVR
jgi:hypothetical protein